MLNKLGENRWIQWELQQWDSKQKNGDRKHIKVPIRSEEYNNWSRNGEYSRENQQWIGWSRGLNQWSGSQRSRK